MTHARINLISAWNIKPLVLACMFFTIQIADPGWTDWIGPVGGVRLRARLLNETDNSKLHAASMEVEVKHVWLHTPGPSSAYSYGVVAAVLRYQLDSNPPVVTPDPRLRFEQLPSGNHVITIVLLGADDRVISGPAKLSVHIP
jgi:hypothetical protein